MSRSSKCNRIYISDIPVDKNDQGILTPVIDEKYLLELFHDYNIQGHIKFNIKEKDKNNTYAYTFIRFANYSQAIRAISKFNYYKINGLPIRIMLVDHPRNLQTNANLIVKNLPPSIEVSEIHQLFSNYGEVITCKIPYDVKINIDLTKTVKYEKQYVGRDFCYVQFKSKKDADCAIENLNNSELKGNKIEVVFSENYFPKRVKENEDSFTNCYIKNLPEKFNNDDLKNLFFEFGKPVSFAIEKDVKGKSKQFGFCRLETHQQALNAIKSLNGRNIDGHVIYCSRALSKEEREKEKNAQIKSKKLSNAIKYEGRNIYIKNLDLFANEDDILDAFSIFGEIESIKIMRDRDGRSQRWGFVCYKTIQSANYCLMNSENIFVLGKKIYVALNKSNALESTNLKTMKTSLRQNDFLASSNTQNKNLEYDVVKNENENEFDYDDNFEDYFDNF